jgi:predicted transcriptional regulator
LDSVNHTPLLFSATETTLRVMDSTTRELLEARQKALSAKFDELFVRYKPAMEIVQEITNELAATAKEIEEVNRAIKSLDDEQAKGTRIKIMDAVLETLSRNPLGMTAKEILAELNSKYYGGTLMRHSLSPQLSRLKDRDKKIEFRNERWIRLPDQPNLFPPIKRRV